MCIPNLTGCQVTIPSCHTVCFVQICSHIITVVPWNRIDGFILGPKVFNIECYFFKVYLHYLHKSLQNKIILMYFVCQRMDINFIKSYSLCILNSYLSSQLLFFKHIS